ncbi:MAG: DUF72 domain-containing protein [Desulfobacterales bacterium]|nr:DUF72 domain-containing protein [Desulfobacterales bacterium]
MGNFYPKGTKPADFLREYAKRLTNIEGNTTFYAVPSQKTLEGWAAETPDTFVLPHKSTQGDQSRGGDCRKTLENGALGFVDVMRGLGAHSDRCSCNSRLASAQACSPTCRPFSPAGLRTCASLWKSVTSTGSSRRTTGRSMRCFRTSTWRA